MGKSWKGDQQYIGVAAGHAVRSRSIVNIMEDKRWNPHRLTGIRETQTARSLATMMLWRICKPHMPILMVDGLARLSWMTCVQGRPPPEEQAQPVCDLKHVRWSPPCTKCNLHSREDARARHAHHSGSCTARMRNLHREKTVAKTMPKHRTRKTCSCINA